MNFRVLISKAVTTVRERRFASAARAAGRFIWRKMRRPSIDDFDQRHGTDTSGELALWEMRVSSPNARFGVRYQACSEVELVQVVNGLGIDTEGFTFIDLGCGKGRALLVAARLGFRQVIGLEIGAELADIAKANLVKMHVTNALVIYGDAAEYVFPSGDLLIYLNNPFGAPVMSRVVHALEHRVEYGGADEIYVAYNKPRASRCSTNRGPCAA